MSTHNIGFYGELTKIIHQLSSNTLLICSSVRAYTVYTDMSVLKQDHYSSLTDTCTEAVLDLCILMSKVSLVVDFGSVPFQHFGNGAGSFELGRFVRKIGKSLCV